MSIGGFGVVVVGIGLDVGSGGVGVMSAVGVGVVVFAILPSMRHLKVHFFARINQLSVNALFKGGVMGRCSLYFVFPSCL